MQVDNFEWNFGFGMKFGLYEWDKNDETQQRKERKSAALLRYWFDRLKTKLSSWQTNDHETEEEERNTSTKVLVEMG